MSMSAPDERDVNTAALSADWDRELALLSEAPPAGMDDVETFDRTGVSTVFCLNTKGRAFLQQEVDELREADLLLDLI
ncbi:hypothetical protein M4I32_07920 [Microbacterium sp. LRZ72]|uniref:hypothetical protein n=1 Tax=Microbacterium sp. LRZ72 TaxID=2942481 RepID=UPI0029B505A0|nr:hypothetical protein [Microbacterium sp. LRZ72]MDX2376725.1 hypothetical protein [Microbacterium sp. LRZ72]